jgi:lipoprotein-releasing system ATP-binding protein
MSYLLSAKNITKKYNNLSILKGIDIDINQKEIVSIVGSSGAGKSTLLHILGTLDTPDTGEIILNNTRVDLLKGNKLATFRNKQIGFIFQFHHLLPEFTALENVCIPAWIAKRKYGIVKKEAAYLLEVLGLKDRLNNKPQQLSGGEQQRVAAARALINKPSIVFADEPTGNLDSNNAKELHQFFTTLSNEFNQSFLIVTHNQELATLSNRILYMKDGKMI